MKLTLFIVVLTTCLFLNSKINLAQLNWTTVLPYFNILCGMTSSCDEFYNADHEGQSRAKNVCCKGCECKEECFDDSKWENMERYSECLNPQISNAQPDSLKYKFVVDAPQEGCVGKTWLDDFPRSCSPDDKVAPWGNFYPVYSHEKKISFKNMNCARCHGANNTVKWETFIIYYGDQGYENALRIHQTYTSKDVDILFEAPNIVSQDRGNVCFNEKDGCDTVMVDDFFIPSNINMSRQQVVQACEQGPRSFYLANVNKPKKNVFCALCHDYASIKDDSLICKYKEGNGDLRGAGKFTLLLDGDYVDSEIQEFTKTDSHTLACRPSNDNSNHDCREVICPTLQTRYSDGTCRYPMAEIYADIFILNLNLVSPDVIKELQTINRTDAETLSLFERFSPWKRYWTLISIGVRVDKCAVNKTEVYVKMKRQTNAGLNPGKFVQGLLYTLSKPWILDVGVKMSFAQQILSYYEPEINRFITSPTYGKRVPSWAEKFHDDFNDTDFVMPIWDVLFHAFSRDIHPSLTLVLSKLLFCNQIELHSSEFKIQIYSSPAYLPNQDRYLFRNEYYRYTDENGNQSITVCIEESGFVLVSSRDNCPSMNFDTFFTLGILVSSYMSGLDHL